MVVTLANNKQYDVQNVEIVPEKDTLQLTISIDTSEIKNILKYIKQVSGDFTLANLQSFSVMTEDGFRKQYSVVSDPEIEHTFNDNADVLLIRAEV